MVAKVIVHVKKKTAHTVPLGYQLKFPHALYIYTTNCSFLLRKPYTVLPLPIRWDILIFTFPLGSLSARSTNC